jgi:hypothetical protein
MLHDASDRAKTLHGALLQSEVMAQNGALAAQRARVAGMRAAQEAAFVEQQKRALEVSGWTKRGAVESGVAKGGGTTAVFQIPNASLRYETQPKTRQAAELAELAKLEAERAKLLAQRDVQAAQLEDLKRHILAERRAGLCLVGCLRDAASRRKNHPADTMCLDAKHTHARARPPPHLPPRAADRAEGELVRAKAAEEAAELLQKEAAWRAKMRAMNGATAAANATLLAFRAAERARERLMDAAVEGEGVDEGEMGARCETGLLGNGIEQGSPAHMLAPIAIYARTPRLLQAQGGERRRARGGGGGQGGGPGGSPAGAGACVWGGGRDLVVPSRC